MSRSAPDASPSPAVRPAERYGDGPSPRRRLVLGGVVVLAAVFLAWVVWAGLHLAQREVRWSDVGYDVVDDTTVEVTFTVVKDPGSSAVCTIEALNARHAQVGLATVEIGPADERGVVRTATVRTAERAVTGVVDRCAPA